MGQMPSAPVRIFPIGTDNSGCALIGSKDRWCALIGSKDRVINLTQIPFKDAICQRYMEKFLLH